MSRRAAFGGAKNIRLTATLLQWCALLSTQPHTRSCIIREPISSRTLLPPIYSVFEFFFGLVKVSRTSRARLSSASPHSRGIPTSRSPSPLSVSSSWLHPHPLCFVFSNFASNKPQLGVIGARPRMRPAASNWSTRLSSRRLCSCTAYPTTLGAPYHYLLHPPY